MTRVAIPLAALDEADPPVHGYARDWNAAEERFGRATWLDCASVTVFAFSFLLGFGLFLCGLIFKRGLVIAQREFGAEFLLKFKCVSRLLITSPPLATDDQPD